MTAKEIERLMRAAGWYEVSQKGSHKHFKHDVYAGKITVPQHGGDVPIGTAKAILKQANIKEGKS